MCMVSTPSPPASHAASLSGPARQQIALDALAGGGVSRIAAAEQVSRKFVYQQLHQAHQALDQAFAPPANDPPDLLFWLPVTKPWLQHCVLGLALICHSSLRGVQELLADLLDHPLSLGHIHNILHQAAAKARLINDNENLQSIRIAAWDEIFQAGRPVLVAADVASTYSCLLGLAEHRDATTWGVRLLQLTDRGFCLEAAIADFAGGLRAGCAEALPDVPCRGDVFHALQTAPPWSVTWKTGLTRQSRHAVSCNSGRAEWSTAGAERRLPWRCNCAMPARPRLGQ